MEGLYYIYICLTFTALWSSDVVLNVLYIKKNFDITNIKPIKKDKNKIVCETFEKTPFCVKDRLSEFVED